MASRPGPRPFARASPERLALLRRGLLLEYATLGWNVVGTVVVVAAAFHAGSVALAGFGLDSLIEILASLVVVWQLTGTEKGRERPALRIIGTAFFALAVYILAQAGYTLYAGHLRAPQSVASCGSQRRCLPCFSWRGGSTLPASGSITPCCARKGASRWWTAISPAPSWSA
jgi:hypothetical protein